MLPLTTATLCLILGWSAVAWLGHLCWWVARDGRSRPAALGMRYSAYVLIVSASGALVCGAVLGVGEAWAIVAGSAVGTP